MSVVKLVRVVCDDCRDAVVEVSGGSQADAWRAARGQGWSSFARPSGESWLPRVHVCRRCIEYGRPYAGVGVPSWQGLGLVAGQNVACG